MATLGLAILGGGCASHQAPAPPPLHGLVNLDELVRRHPGWSGVGQYDAALRRLEQAARALPQGNGSDQKLATLPALLAAGSVSLSSGLSAESNAEQVQRLKSVQQSLLESLRGRRAMVREDQIRQKQDIWRSEARLRFSVPLESVQSQPDLELQLLEANVATLTRTIAGWKQAPPPAPKLEALRTKVNTERAKLEALLTTRAQQREIAQTRHREEIARARADRTAYVQAQADTLEAHLRTEDERLIAAQAARLTQQRTALLGALAQPPALTVPTTGFAGQETLPHGLGVVQSGLSQASLTASEVRLRAQRARWVKFLYDDTQAAALDAAGQRGWDVTFGHPRPGDRDLTGALAQALTSSLWRL